MAFEDYDEYEQGEQVRKWIKENGIAVAVGIVIALALIFGYREWKSHEAEVGIQAATQFAVVEQAVQRGDKQAMSAALEQLQKNYAGTAYASFGSAAVADYQVGKDHLKPATQNLEWAVAHSGQSSLQALFRLRLARVLLAQAQSQQALAALDKVPAGEYAAVTEELRGDALLQLGKTAGARTAYRNALAKLGQHAPARRLVQMKLNNLTPAQTTPGKHAQ